MESTDFWADYTLGKDRVGESTAAARNTNNDLDKNAFLMLLITQMKYQDPLNPMDDQAFVAQMAQFTALEQMQNLNQSFEQQQAYALIGKTVAGLEYNESTAEFTEFFGRVDSVTMKNNEAYIVVEEKTYKLSSVTDVYEDLYQLNLEKSIAQNTFSAQNINLVGKYIQAIIMNGEEAVGFVEGKVDYVKFSGETPILVVGGKEVYPQEVISVSDNNLLIGKELSISVSDEGGAGYTVTGAIQEVLIIDGKAYVQVNGEKTEIEKIDTLIDALKYVGQEIKSLQVNGVAKAVLVKNGVPHFIVGEDNEEVKFSDIVR